MNEKLNLKKVKKRASLRLTLFLLLNLSILTYSSWYFFIKPTAVRNKNKELIFVEYKDTEEVIAKKVEEIGAIKHWKLLTAISRLKGAPFDKIEGVYRIKPGSTPLEIHNLLSEQKRVTAPLMVRAGFTMLKIDTRLFQEGITDGQSRAFYKISKDKDLVKKAGINSLSFEGYIFPRLYQLPKNVNPRTLLLKMYNISNYIWDENFEEKARKHNLSKNKVLTLASLMEKETDIPGIYEWKGREILEKLKNKQLLNLESALKYALNDFHGPVDPFIDHDSKFNTYKYYGFPPGPIGAPSIKAIDTAIKILSDS